VRGTVAFHPVDASLFGGAIAALLAGEKVQPEPFLAEAVRMRHSRAAAARTIRSIERALADAEPPKAPEGAGIFERIKATALAVDHRVHAATRKAMRALDPELHLYGRPFFVTEESAERVASVVHEFRTAPSVPVAEAAVLDQLARLDPEFPGAFPPDEDEDPPQDLEVKHELMAEMRELFELAGAARRAGTWEVEGRERPALPVLLEEGPWRAVRLHARVMPYWRGRDVDGLETVCRATGIEPPACLRQAHALFERACSEFPGFPGALPLEIPGPCGVGAYVAPEEVGALLDFLAESGAAIIRAASRHGEGPACSVLLRKIRECCVYAQRHGLGYLESAE
jgi:hypothetical protein